MPSGTLATVIATVAVWAALPSNWVPTPTLGPGGDPFTDAMAVSFEIPSDEFHLVFPQDPSVTWFDSTYGAGKEEGRRHQGEDLMAPKMTPVFAVADGVVVRTGTTPRAGAHVWIDHGNGWTSWYMHLNNDSPGTDDGRAEPGETFAPGVEDGSFVVAGQLIGYVGDSGNAEGTHSHTHFELHKDGRPVNPYPYLAEAFDRAMMAIHAERLAELLPALD
jgi:murein DD-endopeptidase MepM/ murein hydrolase activator NlpD